MRRTQPMQLSNGEVVFGRWPKSAPHHVHDRDSKGVGSVSRFNGGRWIGVLLVYVPSKFGANLTTRLVPGRFKSRKTAVAAVLRAAEATR